MVGTVAEHVEAWAKRPDPTMTGPRRGLPEPPPVTSLPGVVIVVGREGSELLADDHNRSAANAPNGLAYGVDAAHADPPRDRIPCARHPRSRPGLHDIGCDLCSSQVCRDRCT